MMINFVKLVNYIIQYHKKILSFKMVHFFCQNKTLKVTVESPVMFQLCFLTNCVSVLLANICTNVPLSLLLTDHSTSWRIYTNFLSEGLVQLPIEGLVQQPSVLG